MAKKIASSIIQNKWRKGNYKEWGLDKASKHKQTKKIPEQTWNKWNRDGMNLGNVIFILIQYQRARWTERTFESPWLVKQLLKLIKDLN